MPPATSAVVDAPPVQGRPLPYRVVDNIEETHDTHTLFLEPTAAAQPAIVAGQFNMLWAWGLGEVPISTSSLESDLLVHTIRDCGAVTHALCSTNPGDVIGIRGPFGRGWNVEGARGHDVVIVAGGIGLAPLRPAIETILTNRDAYGEVSLVVGSRTATDLTFRGQLDRWWKDRRIAVRTIVDHHGPGWKGNVGIVTDELHRVDFDPARTKALVCGPEIMIRFVGAKLAHRGIDPTWIEVSMERNMQCGVARCGHCQLAGFFICHDGPVLDWTQAKPLMEVREL
ncbi:MAG: FAD/NAD(P)-binding protein [Actinomycetes bacterium]